MTVSELIEKLQAFDQSETVYFHCDIGTKEGGIDGPFFEANKVIDMGELSYLRIEVPRLLCSALAT